MSYIHTVQYYETDKMSITHHSNYIRWMEEARIAFLSEIGWDFAKLEKMGIVSPVLNVTCDYKKSTTFPEKITIHVSVERFPGVKLQRRAMSSAAPPRFMPFWIQKAGRSR